MSSYEDMSEIHRLYQEQERIASALAILDDGGTISSFVVSPSGTGVMAVSVNTVAPSRVMLAGVYAVLIDRYNVLSRELEDLGVTDVPTQDQREWKAREE